MQPHQYKTVIAKTSSFQSLTSDSEEKPSSVLPSAAQIKQYRAAPPNYKKQTSLRPDIVNSTKVWTALCTYWSVSEGHCTPQRFHILSVGGTIIYKLKYHRIFLQVFIKSSLFAEDLKTSLIQTTIYHHQTYYHPLKHLTRTRISFCSLTT